MFLLIANILTWRRDGRDVPNVEVFRFAAFGELTEDLLAEVAPDVVLSPLIGEDFDAVEVARLLQRWDFRGRYRAITASLPCLDAVRAEVLEAAPDVDFDLFVVQSRIN